MSSDPHEDLLMTGVELDERADDVRADALSLGEIHDHLAPHYEALNQRLLDSGAPEAVDATDRRYKQARADLNLLTGFGALLPPEKVTGTLEQELWGSYLVADNARTFHPDLTIINMVRIHGVRLGGNTTGRKDTNEPIEPLHFAYLVGARMLTRKHAELLLVQPRSFGEYTYKEDGETLTKETERDPRVVKTIVHKGGLLAIKRFAEHAQQPQSELTTAQAAAMRASDKEVYHLPVEGVKLLDLWYKGKRVPSLAQTSRRGVRVVWNKRFILAPWITTSTEVGPADLVAHSLGDYEAASYLTPLATAFKQSGALKKLWLVRQAQLESPADPDKT